MHYLALLVGALFITSSWAYQDLLKVTPKDKPEIGNYAFEGEIIELLEKVRAYLKDNGLEPLPIAKYPFSFFIDDTDLEGSIGDMLVYNLSNFEVQDVKFDLLQFKLHLNLGLNLVIDGQYQVVGNIFENILNGEGHFISNTTDLTVLATLQVGTGFDHSEIKDLELSFIFSDDNIIYDNTVTGEKNVLLDNAYLQPFIYRIRDEYVSKICNTLKVVGSDLIHDYPLQDLLQIIINIITGGKGFSISN